MSNNHNIFFFYTTKTLYKMKKDYENQFIQDKWMLLEKEKMEILMHIKTIKKEIERRRKKNDKIQ